MPRRPAQAAKLGLGGIILFGIPAEKDAAGRDSYSDSGIVQQAVKAAKDAAPDLLVITDVCFCEYTDHGHCGVIDDHTGRMDVNNDATLELLGKQALSHAQAGADLVAPSGMMDGMVGAIRTALDGGGFEHVPIMSYAAKYASSFYGPFREAAESTPKFGDRRAYQMDPAAGAGRRCAKSSSTWPKGPTSSWSSRPWPTSTSSASFTTAFPACRWPRTTSPANSRWSKPPPNAAGSTSGPSPSNR